MSGEIGITLKSCGFLRLTWSRFSGNHFFFLDGHSGCGGILKQRESSIRSPNYPNKYPARSDCSWTISAPPGHKIVLDFRDFRLQQNDPCRDWLDIYDGSSIRETKVGRYCGSVKPLPVTSSGHNLHIRFKSDDFIEDRGFRARYNTTLGRSS